MIKYIIDCFKQAGIIRTIIFFILFICSIVSGALLLHASWNGIIIYIFAISSVATLIFTWKLLDNGLEG